MKSRREKRRYMRAPLDAALSFVVDGAAYSGRAKDISIGSMCVETRTPAPFGAEIAISFELPDPDVGHRCLLLRGVVRWVQGGRMCVQFGLLGAMHTHLIAEYGKRHAPAPAHPSGVGPCAAVTRIPPQLADLQAAAQ
jgi:type IV pilus assembly protein PilZ